MIDGYSLYAVSPGGNVLIDEESIPGSENLSTPEEAKRMALILVAMGTHTIRIEGEFGYVAGTVFPPKRPGCISAWAWN